MEVNKKFFLEKKFVVYLGGRGASALISVLAIPLFIRLFGASAYGTFVLNYSIFLMALSLSGGWVNQSIIRFYHDQQSKNIFMRQMTALTILSSCLIGFIVAILFLVREQSLLLVVISFIAFILGNIYLNKSVETQTRMKPRSVVLSEILRLSFFVLVPYLLRDIDLMDTSSKIFLGVLIGYLVGFLFLKGSVTFSLPTHLIKPGIKDVYQFKAVAAYGIPLSIWMVFSPTTNGVDRYLIEYYLGSVALAQYSAVYDIVFKVFSQLSIPLNSIVQPLLMYAHTQKQSGLFKKTLLKSSFYLSVIFIVLFGVFYYFRKNIIVDYLGFNSPEVMESLDSIFIPLIISSFVWQIAILIQKKLEAENRTIRMVFLMVITVLLSALLAIWLLPSYGFIASAYIMLFSSMLYLVLVVNTVVRK